MTESPVLQRVRELVEPITSDLDLDLYDIERRGGTIRITIDTRPGSEAGIDMDQLALATRLISRELDHVDPVPGRYTLEVTSPGVERSLRTPAHFQREIGKTINVRLANTAGDDRRIEGVLIAADEASATLRIDGDDNELTERVVQLADIDRARTVFVWGPQPKKGGKQPNKKSAAKKSAAKKPQPKQSDDRQSTDEQSNEKETS